MPVYIACYAAAAILTLGWAIGALGRLPLTERLGILLVWPVFWLLMIGGILGVKSR